MISAPETAALYGFMAPGVGPASKLSVGFDRICPRAKPAAGNPSEHELRAVPRQQPILILFLAPEQRHSTGNPTPAPARPMTTSRACRIHDAAVTLWCGTLPERPAQFLPSLPPICVRDGTVAAGFRPEPSGSRTARTVLPCEQGVWIEADLHAVRQRLDCCREPQAEKPLQVGIERFSHRCVKAVILVTAEQDSTAVGYHDAITA
ncbi:hypothetical protein CDD83_1807 [Cordyceps sp. RAO-2017]|nr:hypothetical protein CDD83_1807 [Cordyceps sp. RAO-2017]